LRLRDPDRLIAVLGPDFRGNLAPFFLASLSPMAMACLRLSHGSRPVDQPKDRSIPSASRL
jgi:hypothetical protein